METHEKAILRLMQPVSESDHTMGSPTAPATLVQYGNYECIYCRQLQPIIADILQRVDGLRFVYRHFPLPKVHPHSARAAEASEAAAAQGRFWEMHTVLFEQNAPLEDELLNFCAKKAGLDMQRYAREMAEGIYAVKVERDFLSATYGNRVTGTPTLFLNGALLSDIKGREGLLAYVTEAGATVRTSARGRIDWLRRFNLRRWTTRP
jgi:formate-nitrite transporter family protein